MQEELISKNEYMRRYKVGLKRLNEMIANKEVIMRGGKIVISKQTVPLEEYETEREKRIKAEQKLEIMTQRISNLLKEVS